MSTVPKGRVDRVVFYETRVGKWIENAEVIGADPEIVAQLASKTAAARQAFLTQRQSQQAARSATLRFNQAVAEMAELGAYVMLQIRSTGSCGDAGVYALASISPPAKHSPVGAPGTPRGFQVDLWPTGALKLRWKCDNPGRGERTIYQVYRSIGRHNPSVYLGGTGKRMFIDDSLPRNSAEVTYRIQAIRSTVVGLAADFNVNFGTLGRLTRPVVVEAPVAA